MRWPPASPDTNPKVDLTSTIKRYTEKRKKYSSKDLSKAIRSIVMLNLKY